MALDKRLPGTLIQSAVDQFAKDVALGEEPAVPFDLLQRATVALAALDNDLAWFKRGHSLARAVGDEFLTRLELRFRGVENQTHVPDCLRVARARLDEKYPTKH
jgi:hypothetical protein